MSKQYPPDKHEDFKIVRITNGILKECLDLMLDYFFQDELISKLCGISKNRKAAKELLEIFSRIAKDGLSLAAVNDDNKVIAVFFNKLEVKDGFDDFEDIMKHCVHNESINFNKIMTECTNRVDLFEYYQVDSYVEMMFTVTHPDYRRRGMFKKFVSFSIDMIQRMSNGEDVRQTIDDTIKLPQITIPKAIYIICTNLITKKVSEANNLKSLKAVSLKETFKHFNDEIDNDDQFIYYVAMKF